MGAGVDDRGGVGEETWWVALQYVPGVGAATMLRLVRAFGSVPAACAASVAELCGRADLSPVQAEAVRTLPRQHARIARLIRRWQSEGISLITMEADAYPERLRDLRTPPPVLYLRGDLRPEDARAVAIVGSREADAEGMKVAHALALAFAQRGFTIMSGLARGIDTAAHKGALAMEQGRTIAVLGGGLGHVYPPENAPLATDVAARGCLLAEVPPDTPVEAGLLLARDRIQAALARAVVVVQAAPECGSMVTARHAADRGRLVFGVPWDSPPFSEGWAALERLGARPLTPEMDLGALADEIAAWKPRSDQPSLP